MDPNACLAEIISIAKESADEALWDRLGELKESLHDWMNGGGFTPDLGKLDAESQKWVVQFVLANVWD